MLSNKMTFSLMSLITILAFAFIATSAMAQDFDATFSAMDISFAGDTQLQAGSNDPDGDGTIAAVDNSIQVYLTFGQPVSPAEAIALFGANAATDGDKGGVVNVYNKFGALLDNADDHTITVAERDLDPGAGVRNDGKSYTLTIAGVDIPDPLVDNENPTKVEIFLAEGKINNANPNEDKKNKKGGPFIVNLVAADVEAGADGTGSNPRPVSIMLASNLLVPAAGFTGDKFDIIVTLSEEPKEGKFTKDHLDVAEGTASDGVFLKSMMPPATPTVPVTGRSRMYYQYLVTITPAAKDANLVIKLKSFEDQNKPTPKKYMPPTNDVTRMEMLDQLTVKIKRATTTPKVAGVKFGLPKDKVIPAGGYLVVAEDKGGSSVHVPPGDIDKSPMDHERTPAERMYNVIDDGDLPNLESFLANGGTIGVMGPHALMISEIMWGSDTSLDDPGKSQWIELYNAGAEYKTQDGDNTTYLVFYGPGESPATGLHDTAGTVGSTGLYWSLAGKGASGRSGKGEKPADFGPVGTTSPIISMYRLMNADGTLADGTMASSWMQSVPPSLNFDADAPGVHIGSPGAARLVSKAEMDAMAAAEKAKTDAAEKMKADAAAKAAATGTVPKAGNIYISEVMFAGGGSLPQWIEIANSSRTEEINLAGWTLEVVNAKGDTDVSVGSIKFTIPPGTMIGTYGQHLKPSTILIVTEMGRYDLGKGADQVLNLWQKGQTQLILAGVNKRRYSLLSSDAFLITLAPPAPAATTPPATETPAAKATRLAAERVAADARKAATDMVGNLGADGAAAWALPMSEEGARSSIIRSHVQVSIGPAEPNDGTMIDGWVLAADTAFAQATHIRTQSYYGAANDVGTPGFRSGGALPVELSHFRPVRDKATGQVVITWATQSELNNAGFFIKRSQQRDGEFKVINATMVAGAGTTSEKQFYTYTDTTAQPNVVYYYQIEDVSLDGQRQTLTRGIRLKGHVGAAGKATTLWGELKASHE